MALGCSFTNSIPLSTSDFPVPSVAFFPPFAAPEAPALPLALASIYRFSVPASAATWRWDWRNGWELWRSCWYRASTLALSDFRSSLAALSYCFQLVAVMAVVHDVPGVPHRGLPALQGVRAGVALTVIVRPAHGIPDGVPCRVEGAGGGVHRRPATRPELLGGDFCHPRYGACPLRLWWTAATGAALSEAAPRWPPPAASGGGAGFLLDGAFSFPGPPWRTAGTGGALSESRSSTASALPLSRMIRTRLLVGSFSFARSAFIGGLVRLFLPPCGCPGQKAHPP